MYKYKICVYAICKNEEKFVDRWMDAVSTADLVVVLDTGSTDRSVEKLKERGATVYEETIQPWRFDEARNRALNHIPEDIDICVSNDLDEVFEPNWREKLEAKWEVKHTRAKYWFTWSYKPDGTPEKQFTMEKIHRRQGFRWIHPVHEILEYSGDDPDNHIFIDNLNLNHYPDISKPRSQYLPLLELSSTENPQDDRTMFWLGREYFYNGMHDKCIETLKRHLSLPTAVWDEELSASMRYISRSYQAKKDMKESKNWLYKAIAQCPHIREPYLSMANLGYLLEDWPLVFNMVETGLKIKERTGSYLMEPDTWGASFYDLGSICCYMLELYKKAANYAEQAHTLSPNDERIKNNLELIRAKF